MTRARIKTMTLHHTTEGARRLRASSNPDAGLFVAAVPPDMRRSYPLTWELLAALGKEPDVSGAGRHQDLDWELVCAWVLAHGVRHVVLVDAQWIPPRLLPDVVGIATTTGTTLWLVAHQPVDNGYVEALGGWPTEAASGAELANLVSSAQVTPITATPPDYPRLLADSYLTFRAAARRELGADEFELVDARYTEAYNSAKSWFEDQPAGAVGEQALLAYVRGRLHGCFCAEEMLVEVRGIQAAAHNESWLISANLSRLVATAQNASAAAIHSSHTWRRLRAYREPYRGAACALVASEMALHSMLEVRIADVDPDGSAVAFPGPDGPERVVLPEGAEVFLRAQVVHRAIQGAGTGELLFATEEGPMTAKYLANSVRAALADVGVPLYSQQVERAEVDAKRWSQRWGLAVQAL
ncbi:MAG: hypothetical protein ACRDWE_09090 [Acidimicrobiales bacterium]